jgi:hypothetical protein
MYFALINGIHPTTEVVGFLPVRIVKTNRVTMKETTKLVIQIGVTIIFGVVLIISCIMENTQLFIASVIAAIVGVIIPPLYEAVVVTYNTAQEHDREHDATRSVIKIRPTYECYLAVDEFAEGDQHESR